MRRHILGICGLTGAAIIALTACSSPVKGTTSPTTGTVIANQQLEVGDLSNAACHLTLKDTTGKQAKYYFGTGVNRVAICRSHPDDKYAMDGNYMVTVRHNVVEVVVRAAFPAKPEHLGGSCFIRVQNKDTGRVRDLGDRGDRGLTAQQCAGKDPVTGKRYRDFRVDDIYRSTTQTYGPEQARQ